MSPTNSESPVSTAHGSCPRAASISTNAVCSGRWPGVCSARTTTRPARAPSRPRTARARTRPRRARGRGQRAGRRREPPVAGDVVGVVVGLEDVLDRDAQVAGEAQVLADVQPRVDDRRDARVLVADQVRRAAEILVGDLPEDHAGNLPCVPRSHCACNQLLISVIVTEIFNTQLPLPGLRPAAGHGADGVRRGRSTGARRCCANSARKRCKSRSPKRETALDEFGRDLTADAADGPDRPGHRPRPRRSSRPSRSSPAAARTTPC